MFSSGHDMGSKVVLAERAPGPDQHPSWQINGGTRVGAERQMLQEWHYFFDNTRRWRNLRKITIAQVQGDVYAAGLMLMWACDLIVSAEDARFADVVGTRLGMCGVEYFAHPWEFGPRKTKELMRTGDCIDAHEAHALGMVSKVLVKEAVNQTVDNMGFHTALNACFTLHQLNHAHWAGVNEDKLPIAKEDAGIAKWSDAPPVVPAVKDKVRADDRPKEERPARNTIHASRTVTPFPASCTTTGFRSSSATSPCSTSAPTRTSRSASAATSATGRPRAPASTGARSGAARC